MEFKVEKYKELQEVAKKLNDYTKHAWNKDDETFDFIVQVFYFLKNTNIMSCLIYFKACIIFHVLYTIFYVLIQAINFFLST
jgi:hypothetical protein